MSRYPSSTAMSAALQIRVSRAVACEPRFLPRARMLEATRGLPLLVVCRSGPLEDWCYSQVVFVRKTQVSRSRQVAKTCILADRLCLKVENIQTIIQYCSMRICGDARAVICKNISMRLGTFTVGSHKSLITVFITKSEPKPL